jgi:DNA-binding response OmpR family regulator
MRERALVVDDDPAVCGMTRTVLGETGMEVLSLCDSKQAPTWLRQEKFAVALFDMRMASPSGVELSRLARASGLNQMTPIVLLSDDPVTSAVAEGFSAGASFFLYKPIDKGRLLKLIRAARGTIEHERRRFRRVPLRARVELTNGNQELAGETMDVSLNGMLVQTNGIFPKSSPVQFSLQLSPGWKPIVGSGMVKRVMGMNQMGIQMNPLPMAESARLQEFLLPLIMLEPAEANAASL